MRESNLMLSDESTAVLNEAKTEGVDTLLVDEPKGIGTPVATTTQDPSVSLNTSRVLPFLNVHHKPAERFRDVVSVAF